MPEAETEKYLRQGGTLIYAAADAADIAIGLAFPGILSPVVGALVHNAGSALEIINSALLLKWRKKG